MKIRVFQEKDYEEMINILDEFLEYTRTDYTKEVLETDDFLDSKKSKYKKQILDYFKNLKNARFLVALEDSKIVGYIIGFTEKTPNKIMKKSGHMMSFFVSKKNRGSGIGKKLYFDLINWFKKKNCDHLEIDVFDGNEKTISMYKKWGFKENKIKMKKLI